jgi:starvation-inducible DNA-binding protein
MARAVKHPLKFQAPVEPLPFETKNDLPLEARTQIISLLSQRLADSLDMQSHCKQAHWNVKGPHFIALHLLFDQVDEAIEGYTDQIAERIVQLGGIAEGTVRAVAAKTQLIDYPLALSSSREHVAALSDSLSSFGRTTRMGIEEMNDLGDACSADLLTEVTRGVDKWLWFVEAQQQQAR